MGQPFGDDVAAALANQAQLQRQVKASALLALAPLIARGIKVGALLIRLPDFETDTTMLIAPRSPS